MTDSSQTPSYFVSSKTQRESICHIRSPSTPPRSLCSGRTCERIGSALERIGREAPRHVSCTPGWEACPAAARPGNAVAVQRGLARHQGLTVWDIYPAKSSSSPGGAETDSKGEYVPAGTPQSPVPGLLGPCPFSKVRADTSVGSRLPCVLGKSRVTSLSGTYWPSQHPGGVC